MKSNAGSSARAHNAPPRRLLEGQGALPDLLRDFARGTEELPDGLTAAGPQTVSTRGHAPSRPSRFVMASLAGLAACAAVGVVAFVVLRRPGTDGASTIGEAAPRSRAPTIASGGLTGGAQTAAADVDRARPASDQPTPQGSRHALVPGRNAFGTAAQAVLSRDGVAVLTEVPGGELRIELAQGTVRMRVARRRPEAPLRVVAGTYTFTVVGTEFRVRRRGERGVELTVDSGAVAVASGTRSLALIRGPGKWSSRDPQAGKVSPAPGQARLTSELPTESHGPADAPVAVATTMLEPSEHGPTRAVPVARAASPLPPPPSRCDTLLAGRRWPEAQTCYEGVVARSEGLASEAALYELGVIRERAYADLAGAARLFRRCQTEFPRGALRIEATLSLIDLLPRLGRHQEALERSAELLASEPTLERAPELHLLRGNIYREVVRDYARAQREYLAAIGAPGRLGDDAAFFAAVSAELGGRPRDALDGYQAYLERGSAVHAAEARRRAKALRP